MLLYTTFTPKVKLKGPKVFFVTKGVILISPPPANSETEEARTVKLFTVIAYYITSITKELKFLNSHCSIVCSYCSDVCLIAKWAKNDRIFKFFEIERNSPG